MEKARILYVDDEEDNLITFRSVFRRDFDVKTVLSGGEAIEILNSENIDLLISDQRMPKMTGVQLLQECSQKFPGVKRMILTGFSDLDDITDAINLGKVHAYLTKPWNKEALKSTINDLLMTNDELKAANERIKALEEEISKLKIH